MSNRQKALLAVLVLAIATLAAIRWYRPENKPAAPADTRSLIATVTYSCDNSKSITATYYQGPEAPKPQPGEPPTPTGSVDVSISDAPILTLRQTLSADGARYANADESLVFWSKGDTALIMRNNSMDLEYTNCADSRSAR